MFNTINLNLNHFQTNKKKQTVTPSMYFSGNASKRNDATSPKKIEYLCIGDGPQSYTIATTLVKKGIPVEDVVILGPHETPLHYWTQFNKNVGMDPMGVEPDERYGEAARINFPYPVTDPLLKEHMQQLSTDIQELPIKKKRDLATGLRRSPSKSFLVDRKSKAGKPLKAAHVVIAVGNSEKPNWPTWARKLKKKFSNAPIHHVFEQGYDREASLKSWKHVVVVGGGPAAVNLALSLAKEKPGSVTWILRRKTIGDNPFVVDPCFTPLGYKGKTCLPEIIDEACHQNKRDKINRARPAGVMIESYRRVIEEAIQSGALNCVVGEVQFADMPKDSSKIRLKVKLKNEEGNDLGRKTIHTDNILLATGFDNSKPITPFIEKTIDNLDLPIHRDQYPYLNEHLQWQDPRLYVSGFLADYHVGPWSWNITGGKIAAEKITGTDDFEQTLEKYKRPAPSVS
jgi:hypothetical protein